MTNKPSETFPEDHQVFLPTPHQSRLLYPLFSQSLSLLRPTAHRHLKTSQIYGSGFGHPSPSTQVMNHEKNADLNKCRWLPKDLSYPAHLHQERKRGHSQTPSSRSLSFENFQGLYQASAPYGMKIMEEKSNRIFFDPLSIH